MTTSKPRKPTRSLDAGTLRYVARSLKRCADGYDMIITPEASGCSLRIRWGKIDELRAWARRFEREARACARRSGKPK